MTKTYIAALNGRDVAFSSKSRTYTHASVRVRADGSLELVARFGRPSLAKKLHDNEVIVPVIENEISIQGEIDNIVHGSLASARGNFDYYTKQRAKIDAAIAAGVKPDESGWFRDGDHTVMSEESCNRRIADEKAAIERLEARVAKLQAKVRS